MANNRIDSGPKNDAIFIIFIVIIELCICVGLSRFPVWSCGALSRKGKDIELEIEYPITENDYIRAIAEKEINISEIEQKLTEKIGSAT